MPKQTRSAIRLGTWLAGSIAGTALLVLACTLLRDRVSPRGQESAGDRPAHASATGQPGRPRFEDVAERAGIQFVYCRGETGEFWPVETTGGGAAWIDFDGDGWIDLFLVNGTQLPVGSGPSTPGRLFRNLSDGSFLDVTANCGIVANSYGQGCAVADFDNDGDPDLYVTNYGRNSLWRNHGDGTFADATEPAGVPGGPWNTGACFADLDRDGVLDLYVANYFSFPTAGFGPCRADSGAPTYCPPRGFPALPDFLYRGRGDGSFADVSSSSGIEHGRDPGFGALAADLDNDGWPDLYVPNDGEANFLFRNLGTSHPPGAIHLEEVAYEWGAALSGDGAAQASMGAACADFDGNGSLDVAVTNFHNEYLTLYLNGGRRDFVDASLPTGLRAATHSTMGWAVAFIDADNDGWLDLFVANGHLDRHSSGVPPYAMAPHLFHSQKGASLADVASSAGPYFATPHVARGAAQGDFDNDGRVDIAVVHHHEPAALLANQTESTAAAVSLQLVGTRSNRDAINARLDLRVAGGASDASRRLVREIVSGDSYLSSPDRRVLIGLGEIRDSLVVRLRWPSGAVEVIDDLAPGRWLIREGEPPRWLGGFVSARPDGQPALARQPR